MFSTLLDAEQLKPGSTVRHKLSSFHKPGSECARPAASDLRRQRKKEFVYSFRRQKLSEKCRPAFVKEPSYPELRMQQSQHRQRCDPSTACIQSMYLNRGHFRCARPRERIPSRRSCDHHCAHTWRSKNCSVQLQFAAAANDHKKWVFRFVQDVYPVVSVQMLRIGIGVFRESRGFAGLHRGRCGSTTGICTSAHQPMSGLSSLRISFPLLTASSATRLRARLAGSTISGSDPADRFIMGLLRASADAIIVGARSRKPGGRAGSK